MKNRSWILFVICVAVFITLRLLSVKGEPPQEVIEKDPDVVSKRVTLTPNLEILRF